MFNNVRHNPVRLGMFLQFEDVKLADLFDSVLAKESFALYMFCFLEM
jgi:hypothetical protein